MKSTISIDISLLAILFALQFTGNPKTQNFKLLILVVLFAHVVFTSNGLYNEDLPVLGAENIENIENSENIEEDNYEDETPNETENVITTEEIPIVRKNTSDGEFNRNFSTPSKSAVLFSPNPIVSNEVNENLARSRSNFFSDILYDNENQ